MSTPTVTLIVEPDYMAGLLNEELCSDGSPLGDLRVETVTQEDDGSFHVAMGPRETAKQSEAAE